MIKRNIYKNLTDAIQDTLGAQFLRGIVVYKSLPITYGNEPHYPSTLKQMVVVES